MQEEEQNTLFLVEMGCYSGSAAHEIVAWQCCWAQKWDHLWKKRECFEDKDCLKSNFWVLSFDHKNHSRDLMEFYFIVTQIFLIQKLPSLWRDKLSLLSLTIRSVNPTREMKAKPVLLSWTSSDPGQMLPRQNSHIFGLCHPIVSSLYFYL